MKRLHFLILLLMVSPLACGEDGRDEEQSQLDDPGHENGVSSLGRGMGGEPTNSTSGGPDSNGAPPAEPVWTTFIDRVGREQVEQMVVGREGDVYVVLELSRASGDVIEVLKISPQGELAWATRVSHATWIGLMPRTMGAPEHLYFAGSLNGETESVLTRLDSMSGDLDATFRILTEGTHFAIDSQGEILSAHLTAEKRSEPSENEDTTEEFYANYTAHVFRYDRNGSRVSSGTYNEPDRWFFTGDDHDHYPSTGGLEIAQLSSHGDLLMRYSMCDYDCHGETAFLLATGSSVLEELHPPNPPLESEDVSGAWRFEWGRDDVWWRGVPYGTLNDDEESSLEKKGMLVERWESLEGEASSSVNVGLAHQLVGERAHWLGGSDLIMRRGPDLERLWSYSPKEGVLLNRSDADAAGNVYLAGNFASQLVVMKFLATAD